MDAYPEYTDDQLQEREGVYAFASAITKKRTIWRETPNSDVGIDGQIEYRNEHGQATGMIAAAQIKSGDSYLRGNKDVLHYYPSDKHANYWREFPVPVLLVIHDPKTGEMFWTDARQQLRTRIDSTKTVDVPRSQTVSSSAATDFFQTHRPISEALEIADVVHALANNCHEDAGFCMSFFELFGFGIVDIGRKLFFSMSLCMEIAEIRADEYGVGVGVGSDEHDFVDKYIQFLVGQGLIYYDYSDYLIDRDERERAPVFVAPLTKRGRETLAEMQRVTNNSFHECLLRLSEVSVMSIYTRLKTVEKYQSILRKKV
jgi:hypothetical protein